MVVPANHPRHPRHSTILALLVLKQPWKLGDSPGHKEPPIFGLMNWMIIIFIHHIPSSRSIFSHIINPRIFPIYSP